MTTDKQNNKWTTKKSKVGKKRIKAIRQTPKGQKCAHMERGVLPELSYQDPTNDGSQWTLRTLNITDGDKWGCGGQKKGAGENLGMYYQLGTALTCLWPIPVSDLVPNPVPGPWTLISTQSNSSTQSMVPYPIPPESMLLAQGPSVPDDIIILNPTYRG